MTSGRVVLIHDWLNQIGGAENVLEIMVHTFSGPPVYTSIYSPERMPPAYRSWDIRTSFMQRLPGVAAHHQAYLPVYPLAFDRMDLRGYDVVLSNKSGFCHGVHPAQGARHVCYCLAPTRFLWQYDGYRQRESLSPLADVVLRPLLARLRAWDYAAAQRVDRFIAISTEIQDRIRRYYHRDSTIIYPPVDLGRFPLRGARGGEYYLAGGRHIPYKRLDLAVRACSELGLPLVIYGDGRDRVELQKMAGPSVRFLGRVSWRELADLYARARAFIFPGLEDFGIAPLEAQASGCPVIAFGGGGALDTVVPHVTGELFPEQNVSSLASVLQCFDPQAYDPSACRANAERFGVERFVCELRSVLDSG